MGTTGRKGRFVLPVLTFGSNCSDFPRSCFGGLQRPQGQQPLGGTPSCRHLPPRHGRGQGPSICPAGKSQAVSLPNPEAPAELMAPDFQPALSTRLRGLPGAPLIPAQLQFAVQTLRGGLAAEACPSFVGRGPGIASAALRRPRRAPSHRGRGPLPRRAAVD